MAQLTLQTFTRVRSITPSDTVNIVPLSDRPPDALWCGATAGDITVVFADGSTAVVGAVPGTLIPIGQVVRVNATGTTATKLLALWQI